MTWIRPALAGAVAAAVSAGLTRLYLATITIDDGLEGLIYLPILGVLMIMITAHGGWNARAWPWARAAAIGAVAATSVFLFALAAYREDALLARAAIGASVIVAVFPFTGALIGWGLSTFLRRHR